MEYAKKRRGLFAFILILNIVISAVVIAWALRPMHCANVSVVFNQVHETFGPNPSKDYLFDREDFTDFLGTLKSDTCMDLTIQELDLTNHFKIDQDAPKRLKEAREQLRSRLEYQVEESVLKLQLFDRDPEIAERALMGLTERVEYHYLNQVKENNYVSRSLATEELENLDEKIPAVQNQIDSLQPIALKYISANVKLKVLDEYYNQLLTRKIELENIINEINALESSPKYPTYYLINYGTEDKGMNAIAVILFAILANIIALVFEFQVISLLRYFGKNNTEASQ